MKIKEIHCRCGNNISLEEISEQETEIIIDFLYDEIGEGIKCSECGANHFILIIEED